MTDAEIPSHEVLQEPDQRAIHRVEFSPDGKLLASTGADTLVRIWDVQTRKIVAKLKGHTGEVNGLAFSPDGKTLVSGDVYKIAKVWDLGTKKCIKTMELPGPIYIMEFAPDGKMIYVGSREPWVYQWVPDAPADADLGKLRSEYEVFGLAASKDGKVVVHSDGGGGVFLWNAASGELTKQEKHGSVTSCARIAPDGKVFVTGGSDGSVRQWDAATGETIEAFSCPDLDVRSLVYKPDGSLLWVGLADGHIKGVDPVTGEVKKDIAAHDGPVSHIAVSADGTWMATGCLDFTIKLWTAPSA